MTYVRNNFGNTKGDVVTVEMAKAAMEISAAAQERPARPPPATNSPPITSRRFPAQPLDPKTMVDPITLTPVAAAAAPSRRSLILSCGADSPVHTCRTDDPTPFFVFPRPSTLILQHDPKLKKLATHFLLFTFHKLD